MINQIIHSQQDKMLPCVLTGIHEEKTSPAGDYFFIELKGGKKR